MDPTVFTAISSFAAVAGLAFGIHEARRRRTPASVATWSDIWSSEDDVQAKIARSIAGVPVDFFDVLYLETAVTINLLSHGDARIVWRNRLINWSSTPVESDSLEFDFDSHTRELDDRSMEARLIVNGSQGARLQKSLLDATPPAHYRYKFTFPTALPPRGILEYEVEYVARGIFAEIPSVDRLFWVQKILRVTNRVRLTIKMVSASSRIATCRARDITPGGVENLAGCDLTRERQIPDEGEEQEETVVEFQQDFPPLGHWYRIGWTQTSLTH